MSELCSIALRRYPAIWFVARRVLAIIAVALVTYATIAAAESASPVYAFVLTAERGLEFAIAMVLLGTLAIGLRYRAWLEPVEGCLILGMAFYSAFQVVNDSFMERWMGGHFHWWVSARVASFDIALIIWIAPLLRRIPVSQPSPPLIDRETSLLLLGRIVDRMRRAAKELRLVGRGHWR